MKIRDLINQWMRKREMAAYVRGMDEGLHLGKIEGLEEGSHIAEEKLRAIHRAAYDAGVESVHRDYPILRINEKRAHAGTLPTGARLQEYRETHGLSTPVRLVPEVAPPDWLNSTPPSKSQEDKDATDTSIPTVVKLRHAG